MFSALLIHEAKVERPTITQDSVGATKRTWSTVYATAVCRIAPLSAEDIDIARRHGYKSTHRVFYDPADNVIMFQDRMTISSATYDVDSVSIYPDGTSDAVGEAQVTWKR